MKLSGERQHAERRPKAKELVTLEAESEGRIFDPRLDLPPGEWERLQKLVHRRSNILGPRKTTEYPELGWITFVDVTARDGLRGIPGYKESLLLEVKRNSTSLTWGSGNFDQLLIFVAKVLQQFPETKSDFEAVINEANLDFMLRFHPIVFGSADMPLEKLKRYVVELVQIWPEQRERIIEQLFPKGFEEDSFVKALTPLISEFWASHLAAQATLIFPEKRQKIVDLIRPHAERVKSRLQELSQGKTAEESVNYLQAIRDLTILGASQASIDHQGVIQVTFPQPQLSHQRPLPERSEL